VQLDVIEVERQFLKQFLRGVKKLGKLYIAADAFLVERASIQLVVFVVEELDFESGLARFRVKDLHGQQDVLLGFGKLLRQWNAGFQLHLSNRYISKPIHNKY
jgi:hypothetical protein